MINGWMKIALLLTSMAAFWCFAETFLVTEKPAAQRTAQQLRQELAHLMGDIIEVESELIQKNAALQQSLCAHMRSYASTERKSFIGRASTKELQSALKLLKSEKARLLKEKKNVERLSKEMSSFLSL